MLVFYLPVSDTCPAGTYRVTTAGGDDVCRVCPANSVTTTVCECIQGYYTHHLEDPSVSCTSMYNYYNYSSELLLNPSIIMHLHSLLQDHPLLVVSFK